MGERIRGARSVCPVCLKNLPADLIREPDGSIVLEKNCPEHGGFRVPVWQGKMDFDRWLLETEPLSPEEGLSCPGNCGICPEHEIGTCCALLEVTDRCNLRCRYCFADGGRQTQDPAREECEAAIRDIVRQCGQPLLQFSGGEPTLQPDLREFILRVRELGYRVKLDTNGSRPDILKSLCQEGLIDYVAMDIKTCKERYPEVIGIPSANIGTIMESVEFLKQGTVPYEFRTTVVKELHDAEDFARIGEWISGCPNYFLQNYVDSENVLVSGFSSYSKEELLSFMDIVKPYVEHAELRGVDH